MEELPELFERIEVCGFPTSDVLHAAAMDPADRIGIEPELHHEAAAGAGFMVHGLLDVAAFAH